MASRAERAAHVVHICCHPTPPHPNPPQPRAAPEQLLAQRCSLAADVYSLGLVLAELTTGQVLKRRGEWRLPRSPEECPAVVAHIIQQCTLLEPEARPSAAEVRRALLEA